MCSQRRSPWPSRTNPPSALDGVTGLTISVTSGEPVKELFTWNARSDAEVTTMTITLAPVLDPEGRLPASITGITPPARVRTWAQVKFGARAAPMIARVDIGKGCQFSVTGTHVSVALAADTVNTAYTLTIGGWLSFSNANKVTPVPRTLYVESLAASATSTSQPIPAYARQLLPVQRTPLSQGFTIIFRDSGASEIFRIYGGAGTSSFMSAPLDLPGDAYAFIITNDAGSTLDTVELPFGLGF